MIHTYLHIYLQVMHLKTKILFLSIFIFINTVLAYDPEDKKLETVLPAKGTFEAFYPKGEPRGSARYIFVFHNIVQ